MDKKKDMEKAKATNPPVRIYPPPPPPPKYHSFLITSFSFHHLKTSQKPNKHTKVSSTQFVPKSILPIFPPSKKQIRLDHKA